MYANHWKMFGTSGIIEPDKDKLVIEQYTNSWDKFATATKIIYNTDYDIERFFTSMMHKFNVKYKGFSIPPINMFGYFINHWEIHRHGNKEAGRKNHLGKENTPEVCHLQREIRQKEQNNLRKEPPTLLQRQ